MESVHKLGSLLEEANDLFTSMDLIKSFSELKNRVEELETLNNELTNELEQKNKELDNFKNKYNSDISIKNNELKDKTEEISRFTKISLIQQMDKQLQDKINYIKILESQLEKYKNPKPSVSPKLFETLTESNPVIELDSEPVEEQPKKKKLKNNEEQDESTNEDIFNPDEFEDINGFELIVYKKKYYLRDLETNEIYGIKDNQPDEIVGLINSKGRVKFN